MSTHQVAEFYPGFNREVVPVVFSVEGVGFKIDAAVLTAHSDFFSDMLASPDIGLEGEGTEQRPIVVAGTTKEQFANFCRWLTHKAWSKLEATEEKLIDVLHVSHLFQVVDGVKFAVETLDTLSPPLSPCCRLHLALRYSITPWIDGTVRALLCKPADTYGDVDLTYIGISAFSIVLATREKILRARAAFANFPIEPSTPSDIDQAPFCNSHVKCRRIWVERWFTHLARRIHCTSSTILLSDAPAVLQSMSHPGMNPACKDYNLGFVLLSAELAREEMLTEDAVRQIMALVKSQ